MPNIYPAINPQEKACCRINSTHAKLGEPGFSAILALLAAITLAPVFVPLLDAGNGWQVLADSTRLCGEGALSGLSGNINIFLTKLPVVGDYIIKGGLANALIATILISIGRYISGAVLGAALVTIGIIWGLPIFLPALRHGFIFLFTLANAPHMGMGIAKFIGSAGKAVSDTAPNMLAGSLVVSHINCLLSGLIILGSYIGGAITIISRKILL